MLQYSGKDRILSLILSGNRQEISAPLPVFELLPRVPPYVERYR